MDNEEIFTKIEDESPLENTTAENSNKETDLENPFVTGLPNWDLEPLYNPIKRGNKQ